MLTRIFLATACLLIVVSCGGAAETVEVAVEEAAVEEVTRVVTEVVVEEEVVEVTRVVTEEVVALEVIEPTDIAVILIVDDFPFQELVDNPMEFIQKPPLETYENCIVTPSGQGYTSGGFGYTSGGFSGAGAGRPHGELVLAELNALLDKEGGKYLAWTGRESPRGESSISPEDFPWLHSITLWQLPDDMGEISGQYILLVAADTLGFTTENVMIVIDEALNNFSMGLTLEDFNILSIDNFVINMSFGIIPCGNGITDGAYANVDDYLASIENESDLLALERQLASLESIGLPRDTAGEYILRPIHEIYIPGADPLDIQTAYFANDKLFDYMRDPRGDFTVVSVGAAGNFNDVPYPMAPALWDSVVSVSADYSDDELTYCDQFVNIRPGSNDGEIKLNGHHPDDSCIVGTSFAAPRLSLLEAKYLLTGNEIPCDGTKGSSSPPLKYVNLQLESMGVWENLLVSEASTQHCDDFDSILSEEGD